LHVPDPHCGHCDWCGDDLCAASDGAAAVRAAPRLVTPKMRAAASDATLEAAFRAGVLARKIVKRG
jgi:hypothetical protein